MSTLRTSCLAAGAAQIRLCDGNLSLTLGINNVLDADPPPHCSGALHGFNGNVDDIPGQFC